MIYISLAFIAWFIAGGIWIICNLGNKNKSDLWYVWLLCAPVIALIYVLVAPRELHSWYKKNWPYQRPYAGRGRIEGVRYTWGQGGHQWTTINGIKYVTYWNALDKDWKEGEVVNFEIYWDWANLGVGTRKWLKHARNIRAATDNSKIWTQ